jgi:DNA-directed RNA polymerase
MDGSDGPLAWSTGDRGVSLRHISLTPPRSEPIKRRKSEQKSGNDNGAAGMVSKRVYAADRDRKAEGRAIAPNFVHSLDAEHMRFVIRRTCARQEELGYPPQIWMVHDAFGCHPNDMGALREAAAEGLLEIHGNRESTGLTFENVLDEMHGGGFFDSKRKGKGIGTLELSELEDVDLNRWYFLN